MQGHFHTGISDISYNHLPLVMPLRQDIALEDNDWKEVNGKNV